MRGKVPRKLVWALAGLGCLTQTLGSAPGFAQPSLYLIDGTFSGSLTRIFSVDPTSGIMQLKADLGTAYTPVLAMAAANATTLYLAASDNSPTSRCGPNVSCILVRVDLDPSSTIPALIQEIGVITEDGTTRPGMTGLSFRNDGLLYALNQDTNGLYTIDLTTAVATRIGTVDLLIHGGDLTFDDSDRLWLWSNIGEGAGLYEVDLLTSHASLFDPHPNVELSGLAALGHGASMWGSNAINDRIHEMNGVVGFTGTDFLMTLGGVRFNHSRGDLDSPFCEDNVSCSDSNVCTVDQCGTGGCQNPPEENGFTCDDADACTQTDTCQDGTCAGGSPVLCQPPDSCHDAGTCDPTSGNCENAPAKPDGTSCDDGNACTVTSDCQSGTCAGGSPVVCPPPDGCHAASTCNPATGICDPGAALADGTSCNDGNACTTVDTCQAGTCTGGSPVTCDPAASCHEASTCNAATGLCEAGGALPDGTSCSDGNACTTVDTCSAGTCTGGSPVTCDPAASCHEASTCNAATGLCEAGGALPDGTSCDDGNACTTVDTCAAGTCSGGSPVTCAPAASCHEASTCNPSSGICEQGAALPDGTACNDGNACTTVDTCVTGTCAGSSPVTCAPADACREASTCNPGTGLCSESSPKPEGTLCSDGNACTMGDACVQGSCVSGPPTDLDGDGRIDAACAGTDCNDTNPFVWAAPGEVAGLVFSSTSAFSWTDQAPLTGPEVSYDVASGPLSAAGLGFDASACLQAGGGLGFTDGRPDPAVGQGFWYLVRGRDSCGTGTYGTQPRDASIISCDPFPLFNGSARSNRHGTPGTEEIRFSSSRAMGANP